MLFTILMARHFIFIFFIYFFIYFLLKFLGRGYLHDSEGRLLHDIVRKTSNSGQHFQANFLTVEEKDETSDEQKLSLPPAFQGSTENQDVANTLEPENQVELSPMKREEERFEATVLNNPKPKIDDKNEKTENEKIEKFVKLNAHDIASDLTASEKKIEMEEGDVAKDTSDSLKEILKNAAANNEKVSDSSNSKNKDDNVENQSLDNKTDHDNSATFKNDNKFLSEFSNLIRGGNDLDSPNHNLEEEVAVDPFALTEENGLNKKLDILKNKIKQRQKLNRLKEEEQMLHDQKYFEAADIVDNSRQKIDNDTYDLQTLERNFNMPTLTLKNITDIGRVRGSGAIAGKPFFAFSYDPMSPFGKFVL